MPNIPNEKVLKNILHKIEEEYDLLNRLNRYKSQSELIAFASNQGLTEIDDAVRALFVADFIVTVSELPSGGTDNERYSSIIRSFMQGRSRCSSSDSLMRIFYLAYKIATTIRRQDLFMAGRGLSRKAALIRLKDSYITPYLAIASEILGKGPCGWELGILSAALKRMYPDNEIQQFKEVPEYTAYKILTEYIWNLLVHYEQKQIIETNPTPIIPNIEESKSILLFDTQKTALVSLWNTIPANILKFKTELPSLSQFLTQNIEGKQLILLRGSILNTMEHFFIVRDPFTTSKPIFILQTPADELNLSRVLTILHLRGLEQDGWKSLFTVKEEPVIKPIKVPVTEPKETVDVGEVKKGEIPPVKEGFFAKIKRVIFGKKPEVIIDDKPTPKHIKPRVSIKMKEDKKQVRIDPFMTQSAFIAQGITVDAVSDINLFELFDTVREKNYFIAGTFETDFEETTTKFYSKPINDLPSKVVSFFNGLDHEISTLYSNCFGDNQVLIEELFFMAEDGQQMIISVNGNQERVVGAIAITDVDKILDWQSREKEVEPLQRRSLQMRTSQLLAARRHTPFDEAVERIYESNFNIKGAKMYLVNQPIFSLR
ncbi:MAG: hypothetical protein ACFFB2_08440 [Promethearchaeota archaeon]